MIAPPARHVSRALRDAPRAVCRLCLAAFVAVLLARPSSAAGVTRVVFTTDVESTDTLSLPAQIDTMCADGSACGLMEIVRQLRERGWPGTFFLNVFEHHQWGESAMRDLAVRLQAAGQDVALHTHPQWGYDKARSAMNAYNLDEQTTIVRDGVRLLQAWTGQPVVAHRTGAYAADERTLDALERNGVLVDSSVFWKYPTSRLDGLGLPRNLPARHGRLTEIPVTVYERQTRPTIFAAAFPPIDTVRKIDPNWFIDADEARSAIDAVVGSELPTLVIFLHSFSFIGTQSAGAPPAADRHSTEMFRVMLEHLASKNLPVVTMRELAREGVPPSLASEKDVVPRVAVRVGLPWYMSRRINASRGVFSIAAVAVVVVCAAAVLLLARRRQATHGAAHRRDEARPASAATGRGRP
jgi:peptidoglycan/xylan/chitin deacetylase (PgdA/CDA1 family)